MMDGGDLQVFTVLLSVLWFIFYWVFGGVFFTVIAVLRLGRIKKIRFSCLYTILAALAGYGAAKLGIYWAGDSINQCLAQANGVQEQFIAIFACGIVGIFTAMMIGAVALMLGGFLVMAISKTHEKRWFERKDGEEGNGNSIIPEEEELPEERVESR
ncbi:MAG: hypothetical protein ABIG32_02085 [Candidatus Uhrbacteria bacterium]|nr:hypothetical protein [Patescibacteria group bacterium]MBU1907264.1 hypothetical protein [Patescibacteria group bacterium]